MSPRAEQLDAQASAFADDLSSLLNKTVTDGIPIKSVLREDGKIGWIGYGITKQDFAPGRLIPLTFKRAQVTCLLHIMLTLHLDEDVHRLVVQRSTYGVYCRNDFDSMIFHYDFDREPDNEYPGAHFQVAGASESLDETCKRAALSTPLSDLHFPVGGKRYRPSLEDVIEFLVIEGISRGKSGWEKTVAEHREKWHDIQLRSVVRRDPEIAVQELRRQGYTVTPPEPPT